MIADAALNRFVAHLTMNPWTRNDSGEREMLAGKPLEDVQVIELNGVLTAYVAVAMDSALVELLAPTEI